MEVLSDILRSMRVEGSVFFCDHVQAPWSMDLEDTSSASCHLVRRSECWVMSGERMECLGPGDLVFIEPGRDHVLVSHSPNQGPPPAETRTLLLCGYYRSSRNFNVYMIDASQFWYQNQFPPEYCHSDIEYDLVVFGSWFWV